MGFFDIFRISKIKAENAALRNTIKSLEDKLTDLGADDYFQVKEKIREMKSDADRTLNEINQSINTNNITLQRLQEEISALTDKNAKLDKQLNTNTRKLSRSKKLYKSIEHAMDNFFESDLLYENCKISRRDFDDSELIAPSIILKLHCMDVKSLRKAYRENEKSIDKLLEQKFSN